MSEFRMVSRGIAIGAGSASALALLIGTTSVRAADDGVIAEVIVTAQKRSENLQDVPVSISVVDSRQLENLQASQLADVAPYVPGLQVESAGSPGQTTMSLRGISSGTSQTVGTYIDDTPVGGSSLYSGAAQFQLDLLPYDIDRLEVLRGPQGTLYGASTIGGLLKYATRAPNLDEFELRAGAEVSSMADAHDSGYGGRVGVNAPLVKGKVAVRASYAYQLTPGYIDNAVTGKKDQNEYTQDGGRLALLWQLNDAISLKLSGVWQSIDADANANEIISLPPGLVRLGGGRKDNNLLPEPFTKDVDYYSATLNWQLDWATFVSATSYSDTSTARITDATPVYGLLAPGTVLPFDLGLDLTKWTQEFRLVSNTDGKIEWLVGAFYTDEDSNQTQVLTALNPANGALLATLADLALPSTYKEIGLFGNFTYKFTDKFDITAGARWSSNDQNFSQNATGSGGLISSSGPFKSSEDVWTYMVSPRFHASDATMLYARVASGYRPGGPNVQLGGAPPQVSSDSVTNYELGLKTEFLAGRGYLDLAVFYMDWKDIQVGVNQNGVNFLANAGAAESKGFELTAAVIPVKGLTLGANVAYTDSKLTADLPPPGVGQDGDRLSGVPKWSGSLTVDYGFPVAASLTGRIGAGFRKVGSRLSSYESAPDAVTADSYSALDLSAGLSSDRWTLRLYARNVTDEQAELNNSVVSNALGQDQFIVGTPVQPRTIGLSLDVTF